MRACARAREGGDGRPTCKAGSIHAIVSASSDYSAHQLRRDWPRTFKAMAISTAITKAMRGLCDRLCSSATSSLCLVYLLTSMISMLVSIPKLFASNSESLVCARVTRALQRLCRLCIPSSYRPTIVEFMILHSVEHSLHSDAPGVRNLLPPVTKDRLGVPLGVLASTFERLSVPLIWLRP
jgi:hypothetical protein